MSPRCLDPFFRFVLLIALCGFVYAPAQAQQSSASPLSKPQLEQLVAPIALHPDPLLSQMLMASTYPTEVVQAARWAKEHPGVSGTALEDAMQKQPWDPSVKALAAVPQALQMMSDKLEWTQQLGDAFLGQQEELLAAVQRLRQRAEAAGHLKSSEQQTVKTVQAPTGPGTPTGPATPMIAIEPANPEYLSVPVYDPRVVYGDWPYPEYEPYYWYPAGFTGGGVLAFATAAAIGSAIWGNLDWWRNRVDINVNRFNQFNRTKIADNTWRHNPGHRGNVPYRDAKVGQRFGQAGRTAARDAYRGKADAGRRDLAKGQGDGGAKAKAAQGGQQASLARQRRPNAAGKAKAAQGGAAAKAKSAGCRARQARGSSQVGGRACAREPSTPEPAPGRAGLGLGMGQGKLAGPGPPPIGRKCAAMHRWAAGTVRPSVVAAAAATGSAWGAGASGAAAEAAAEGAGGAGDGGAPPQERGPWKRPKLAWTAGPRGSGTPLACSLRPHRFLREAKRCAHGGQCQSSSGFTLIAILRASIIGSSETAEAIKGHPAGGTLSATRTRGSGVSGHVA